MTITKNDSAFQSQALFPFSSKTTWGQKVDKYDVRMLLTDRLVYASTSVEERPSIELQMVRYSSLLLYLSEGSSDADILDWSKEVIGNRKTGSISDIASPTLFEEQKRRFLLGIDESDQQSRPTTSLPRWSNRQLDKIALRCDIPRFSKLVYREDEQESQDVYIPSRGDRKAFARERKRYQLHLSDRPSKKQEEEEEKPTNPQTIVPFEISTSAEDGVVILEDHLSSKPILRERAYNEQEKSEKAPPKMSTSSSASIQIQPWESRGIASKEGSGNGKTQRDDDTTGAQSDSRRKSPDRPKSLSRSPVRPRNAAHSDSYSRDIYGDYRPHRRSPSSSPPRKKISPAQPSSYAKSKLDRELEALEEKYSKKRA